MTYPLFLSLFLVLPILVLAYLQRGRWSAPWWRRAVAFTIVLALLYTTPWDNYLVATGVWTYDRERVWNIVLGYVPLEEYLFFVLQVVLTGLVTLALLGRETRHG